MSETLRCPVCGAKLQAPISGIELETEADVTEAKVPELRCPNGHGGALRIQT